LNGSEQMRLTSTGLGIGTSSPAAKLDVQAATGTFRLASSTGTNAAYLYATNTGGDFYYGRDNSTGSTFGSNTGYTSVLWSAGAYPMAFFTNGTERMRLDSSGNLGVGTTSPGAKLEVYVSRTSSTNAVALLLNDNVTGVQTDGVYKSIRSQSNSGSSVSEIRFLETDGGNNNTGIAFATAPTAGSLTERMRVGPDGNVGIGTTSPTTKLTVYDATAPQVTFNNGTSTFIVGNSAGNNNHILYGTGAYPIIFYTNAVEGMRLDSSGNLLVGQTSPSQSVLGFGVSGAGGTYPTGTVNTVLAGSTDAVTTWNTYSTGAGAYRFYVGMGGTIFATSIVITAISDQRLKENIRDIDTGLGAIMALKPRRFDWKDGKGQDKKNAAGFIAQEFEEVFPECVSTSKAGGDGIEYKNINHETLIPTLVKAIQELKAEFDAYKASHP
jgi:hypothetical protein